MSDNDQITVCAECLQASCWQGIFMCYESGNADIVKRTRKELVAMGIEHPSYFKTDREISEGK